MISAESIVTYMQGEATEQDFLSEVLAALRAHPPREQLGPRMPEKLAKLEFFRRDDLKGGANSPLENQPRALHNFGAVFLEIAEYFLARRSGKGRPHRLPYGGNADKSAEFKKKVQSYYFNLRERAQDKAAYYLSVARHNPDFCKNEEELRSAEIQLAKAEALGGDGAALAQNLTQLKSSALPCSFPCGFPKTN